MKRISIFLAAMLLMLTSTAQVLAPEWKHEFGVRMGGRLNDMNLSYTAYDKYEHSMMIGLSAGLFYRHRINDYLSLRTDVVYAVRGVDINWCDVNYAIRVPYLDVRPMAQLGFCPSWYEVVPYITLGAECNFPLSGNIMYKSNIVPPTSIALNQSNFKPFDFALWVGIGTDIHFEAFYRDFLLIIEAGADLALLNNFASAELDGDAQVLNPEMENNRNYGTRKNRGIEVSVGLGIPLVKKKKYNLPEDDWGIIDFWDEVFLMQRDSVQKVEVADTIIESEPHDTVVVPETPYRRVQDYVYRECYTLEELLTMVAKGKEVCDVRICLFDIKFAYDSYELTLGSKRKLDRVVKLLMDYPKYNLHVNGHTDSIGSDAYNDKLSLNRALAVVNYLIDKGINASRLSYKGFGERYPIESNATDYGRLINRRVEFELYCTEQKEVELETGENNRTKDNN